MNFAIWSLSSEGQNLIEGNFTTWGQSSLVLNVSIRRLKRCRRIGASSFTNAYPVMPSCGQSQAIAASSVPTDL